MTVPTKPRRMTPALLVLAVCLSSTAVAALELGGDINALLAYARKNHPEVQAMQYEAAAAHERVGVAEAWPDPMLKIELANVANQGMEGGFNLLPSRVGSTRYTVSQMVPWFGKTELKRGIAEARARDADLQPQTTWRDLARGLRQAHARWFSLEASLGFARENLTQLEQLEQIALGRYAHGIATQQEAIRAQTERSMLLGDIAMLEGERDQLAARLRMLLGNPPELKLQAPQHLQLPTDVSRFSRDSLAGPLRAANPWLSAEEARVEAAERGRELVYKERYPDLTLGISPMQERNRVGAWDLMFEVTIPLQQQRRRSEEREAERMLDAARAKRAVALNNALAELDESLAMLGTARRQHELTTTRLLPQAELNWQAALAAYENGKLEFMTVLDAQRQLRKVREDGVRWRAEQAMRYADIERLTGVQP